MSQALAATAPSLPSPRGALSEALLETLRREPQTVSITVPGPSGDPLLDDDLQLALYLLYELHYRDWSGVDPAWEWEPSLLSVRAEIETLFGEGLEAAVAGETSVAAESIGEELFALAAADDGPSLSRFLETQGSAEHFREFMIQKSAYQLKEADPHSWAIPRVTGAPKAAMLEIQYDEYGSGRAHRMHSLLFAEAMEELGLNAAYGAYLDRIPGYTLATVNLTTYLGLRRARRGALVGHLAMFEIGSAIPSRRYGNALRRLGLATERSVDFFDEHVEADSVHENIAAYDLAQRFAQENPDLAADVLFGARALLALDGRFSARVLGAWEAGESSLREPALAAAL